MERVTGWEICLPSSPYPHIGVNILATSPARVRFRNPCPDLIRGGAPQGPIPTGFFVIPNIKWRNLEVRREDKKRSMRHLPCGVGVGH